MPKKKKPTSDTGGRSDRSPASALLRDTPPSSVSRNLSMSHDWKAYAASKLTERGHASMLDYARQHETFPYAALTADLDGGTSLLAPIQIQSLLQYETEGTGNFSYYVRSSLLRDLHLHTPCGLRMHGEWKRILALSKWSSSMGDAMRSTSRRIVKSIQDDVAISDSWLPYEVSDTVLERHFSPHGL